MNPGHQKLAYLMCFLWLTLGCAMVVIPTEHRKQIANFTRDISQPGVAWAQSLAVLLPSQSADFSAASSMPAHSSLLRLQREILVLKTRLEEMENDPFHGQQTARLFQPRLVQAKQIVEQQEEKWRAGGQLNVGHQQDIAEHDWILSDESPLIDIGADHQIEPDAIVLAGRAVIGQIHSVGRWSSTFRLTTDAEFRCPAQVIKSNGNGNKLEAIGSLHGLGSEQCELKYIENTYPVSVGDLVVLADESNVWEQPLVMGVITAAEVQTNQPFWTIQVEPIAQQAKSKKVYVLTESINPQRVSVQ